MTLAPVARTLFVATSLLFASLAQAQANLVTNGDFETCDFTGWTQFGDTSFSAVDGIAADTGACGAYFGPFGIGGISQVIATRAGEPNDIDFRYRVETDETPNFFEFNWDGVAPEFQIFDYTNTGFVTFHARFTASTNSTEISFAFNNPPNFWDLDNVVVTPVPEPASLALLSLGLAGLAAVRRRRS